MLWKNKKKNTFVAENACGSHFFCNLHPISKKAYIGEMLEWLKRHAWKACIPLKGITSSNLVLSAFLFVVKKMFESGCLDFSKQPLFYSGHLLQLLDNLLHIYRLQSSVHFLANHHYRSQSAGTYAAQAVQ